MKKELKNKFITLKKSRKLVDIGDIFVCSIKEGEYIWGRVIRDGVCGMSGPMQGVFLIYI